METNEKKHDFSQEVQSAIHEVLKPYLEKLKTVRKEQKKLGNRIENYSQLKAKTEQDILDLQTAIINGNDEEKLDEVTALKLKLQSMDDIVKGINENLSKLSKEDGKILDAIGNKTNPAFNSIKVRFQELLNEEANQFMEQLQSKYLALKKNLSPCSFVPELKEDYIKNLNTHRHMPWPLKLPKSFENWV